MVAASPILLFCYSDYDFHLKPISLFGWFKQGMSISAIPLVIGSFKMTFRAGSLPL